VCAASRPSSSLCSSFVARGVAHASHAALLLALACFGVRLCVPAPVCAFLSHALALVAVRCACFRRCRRRGACWRPIKTGFCVRRHLLASAVGPWLPTEGRGVHGAGMDQP